jgi:hypothetical protein
MFLIISYLCHSRHQRNFMLGWCLESETSELVCFWMLNRCPTLPAVSTIMRGAQILTWTSLFYQFHPVHLNAKFSISGILTAPLNCLNTGHGAERIIYFN